MNRVVALVSLLIAVLSAYGQQVQWYDVSNFAPIVKQCKIAFTDDRLFVYVNTGDKDINFWVGEPQRTGALVVLNGNDVMEYRQAIFNQFIVESLHCLPENAIVQMHTQPNVQQRTYEESRTSGRVGYTDNTMSGVMEQSNRGQSMQQSGLETEQPERSGSGLEGILENILMLVIAYWLFKATFKAFFSSSSKKSNRDEDYEDGPTWFNDHGQNI